MRREAKSKEAVSNTAKYCAKPDGYYIALKDRTTDGREIWKKVIEVTTPDEAATRIVSIITDLSKLLDMLEEKGLA